MIARNKELPIQSLGSSVFQSWLQMTAPNNICQPGQSHEETFLYMSLGQVEAWCCRAATLDLVFSLELCIFPKLFFFFLWILELPIMPFSPTLSLQFHLLCTALFCVGFSSSCHQISRFPWSLSWGCTDIGESWITDSWTTGQQVILEKYWHSLRKSHHFYCQITLLRGSREQQHTLSKIKEPLCISFNSDTAVRAAENSHKSRQKYITDLFICTKKLSNNKPT